MSEVSAASQQWRWNNRTSTACAARSAGPARRPSRCGSSLSWNERILLIIVYPCCNYSQATPLRQLLVHPGLCSRGGLVCFLCRGASHLWGGTQGERSILRRQAVSPPATERPAWVGRRRQGSPRSRRQARVPRVASRCWPGRRQRRGFRDSRRMSVPLRRSAGDGAAHGTFERSDRLLTHRHAFVEVDAVV